MAFDFPAGPAVDQEFVAGTVTYVWNGVGWLVKGGASTPPTGLTIGDTPPATPAAGDQWWESDTGILWVWYVDTTSAQWVQAAGSGGGATGDFVEVAGDTMTGPLVIQSAGTPIQLHCYGSISLIGGAAPNDNSYVQVSRISDADNGLMPFSYVVSSIGELWQIDSFGRMLIAPNFSATTSGTNLFALTIHHDAGFGGIEIIGDTASAAGHIQITQAGSYVFWINPDGSIASTSASISVISDAALKQDVAAMPYGLNEILQLRPLTYRLINDPTSLHYGFLAEEVQPLLPELVTTSTVAREGQST